MGRIGCHLDGFFEAVVGAIVKGYCQYNRYGESGNKLVNAQNDSVAQYCGEIVGSKEPEELVQTYPRAVPNPSSRVKLAEGYLCSVHRNILEDNKVRNRKDDYEIELPILNYASDYALSVIRI